MDYLSTRGTVDQQPFSDILIGGLAADGGLAIPDNYPKLDDATLQRWRDQDYRQLAKSIIGLFATDIDAADLASIIDRTYTIEAFGDEQITPLRQLDDDFYVLGLSNGPTLAFKDIAMQFLGHLFSFVLEQRQSHLNILGATSGDTGSAAEYAMRGKSNVRVFMLSPHGKMSPFQTAQMYSLQEPNIFNLAIRGVFDDCQDLVKQINQDSDFKTHYQIGAVNSINWGRIVAQVVYYFKAYFAATHNNDQKVDFAVPSGNFGNIYAGHVARQMGLPIHRLILATNENNVLDEFFRTGVYRVRSAAQVHLTSSPSMDIAKASNLERFIYDLVGRNPATVNALWQQLQREGYFDLNASGHCSDLRTYGFQSGTSTHADRLQTIHQLYSDFGEIVDTHTADGIKVGKENQTPGIPLICLETALAAKFEESVLEAIGKPPPRPAGYEDLESLPQKVMVLDPDVHAIKTFIADNT